MKSDCREGVRCVTVLKPGETNIFPSREGLFRPLDEVFSIVGNVQDARREAAKSRAIKKGREFYSRPYKEAVKKNYFATGAV